VIGAARILESAGLADEAFSMYREAAEWKLASELIQKHAEKLLAQGRFRTLVEWIKAVPTTYSGPDPWLQYWHGLALLPEDLQVSRAFLESSFDAFSKQNNSLGKIMAAASLIDTCFYEFANFHAADFWLRELTDALSTVIKFPSKSAELKVYCATMIGLLFRQPWNPMLSICVQRVTDMLDMQLDASRKMTAAVYLLTYCGFSGDFERAKTLQTRVRTLEKDPEVSEIDRYHGLDWLGYYWFLRANYVDAERVLREARLIQERFPQPVLNVDLLLTQTFIALNQGQLSAAQRLISVMSEGQRTNRPIDRQFYLMAKAWLALAKETPDEAIEHGKEALRIADPIGVPFWQSIFRIPLALGLIQARRIGEARNVIDECRGLVRGTCLLQTDTLISALEGLVFLREGRARESSEALQSLFAKVRRREHGSILNRLHRIMPELCAAAWVAQIECDVVENLIREFNWAPPSPELKAWPWTVKIFTLGRFLIERDGEFVKFSGKAPRKVLALLKVLIAYGGKGVPRQRLIDALWSDEEADSAEAALDVALARLRKLLGRLDAITVSNEELTLNTDRCWVDRNEFERIETALLSPQDSASRLMALYKGEFLPMDRDAPWSVRTRQNLRVSFSRHVIQIGTELEIRQSWRDAIAIYESGLEADDLVEEFYQGLMRCHITLGSTSEGMGVFRRLRQTLSVVLGIAPSPTSEALARDLQKSRPAAHLQV
jgi:LuxR family transcriptional regulator, maltose regulon positive regulatory protein